MTDELQPGPRAARGAPAGDPAARAARRRALHRAAAGQGDRRPHARAQRGRSSASRRALAGSASSRVVLRLPVRRRLLVLRAGRAARAVAAPPRGRDRRTSRSIAVERGYNVYQANCARCHGPTGLGTRGSRGRRARLHRPDPEQPGEAVRAPQRAATSRTCFQAGGRYVCGNANSQMPIWADTGNPPGPLNYLQIDELIAFIRAPSDGDLRRQGSCAQRAGDRSRDRRGGDVQRLARSQLQARPGRHAVPGLLPRRDRRRRRRQPGPDRVDRPERAGRDRDRAGRCARRPASTRPTLTAPADTAFTLEFDNDDPVQHNIVLKDPSGSRRPDGRHVVLHRTRDAASTRCRPSRGR